MLCGLADDGGVTTVSRTGRLDMAGLAREHALDPVLMFQASMLEDVLQTVRAASQREKRLVLAHAIFDLITQHGAGAVAPHAIDEGLVDLRVGGLAVGHVGGG